jgi:hypothetical protein
MLACLSRFTGQVGAGSAPVVEELSFSLQPLAFMGKQR